MSNDHRQSAIGPLAALFLGELSEASRQLHAFIERGTESGADELGVAPDALQDAVRAVNGASRVIGLSSIADLIDAVERCLEECATVPNHDGRDTSGPRAKLRAAQTYLERLAHTDADPASFAAATSAEIESLQLALAAPARPAEPRPVEHAVDASLLELFRQEAEACSAVLGDRLIALDTQGSDSAVWEEVMRSTHSLKGAARIVNLNAVSQLAHTLEECFVAAQSGALTLNSMDIDLLLLAVDAIASASGADADGPLAVAEAIELDALTITPRIAELARRGPGAQANPPEPPAAIVLASARPAPVARSVLPLADERASAPHALTASQRAPERVLRIAAESIRQLMGLASESLVESRRMATLSQAVQRMKKRQAALCELLETVDKHSAGDDARGLLTDAKREAREGMRMIAEHGAELEGYTRRAEELGERLYRTALKSQMRPFGDGAAGFPRLVRDIARQLNKRVRLEIVGRDTEVDRDALDKLEAPINHLLRNAIDHGIEPGVERLASGKPDIALLRIEARHHAGMLSITVSDDGRGIDVEAIRRKAIVARSLSTAIAANLSRAELFEFLFLPGFTTTEVVSEISGRGVGLDVVKSAADTLGGTVRVSSERGRGTSFHLLLPVTRSVIRALVAGIGADAYALPLMRIERIARIPEAEVKTLENRRYAVIDGRPVVLVSARQLLGLPDGKKSTGDLNVVVVGDRKQRCGVVVEELRGEHDLVVRPLDPRLGKVEDVAAAAILMDGSVALILDADDIVRTAERLLQPGERGAIETPAAVAAVVARKRVLVVDDSLTVRELERKLLDQAGYEVEIAVDGVDGWNAVRSSDFDLVVTDIDMPRMNGFDLVRSIKQDAKLNAIPVVIVSYKDRDEDRLRGLEVGASCYLSKSSFHDDTLARAVSDLIGEAAT